MTLILLLAPLTEDIKVVSNRIRRGLELSFPEMNTAPILNLRTTFVRAIMSL